MHQHKLLQVEILLLKLLQVLQILKETGEGEKKKEEKKKKEEELLLHIYVSHDS